MKILLADDEAHVRNVMAFKLKGEGYQVVIAPDGQEAFELAQIEQPDLVISDYQMPIMDGLNLCKSLFSCPATSHIPVIMVTSRDFEIGPEQTSQTNIRRVLNKPFSPRQVIELVKNTLAEVAAMRPPQRRAE